MEITHDKSTQTSSFSKKSKEFFEVNNFQLFSTPEEAASFIFALDEIIDLFQEKLRLEDAHYSDELLLQLGSAFGEALTKVFSGEWYYSQDQVRWVVRFPFPSGARYEINVFNKTEKRFKNGDEDSITFLLENVKKQYLEEARSLNLNE
jgi:hypothetical protein